MLNALLDFISPRACRMCGNRLALTEGEICSVCNWQLPRTGYCETAYDNPMARLFWGRFQVERVAGWMHYQPSNPQCKLIYDLKYYNADELAVYLGTVVAKEYSEYGFFEDIDLIVPVPLTLFRRLKRGYNQSERIARGIAEITGLPVVNALKRVRFTESQTRLDGIRRAENVAGAFKLSKPEAVRGKHVLIVDDVITTGATVSACAEELSKAGNVKISVLSLGITK